MEKNVSSPGNKDVRELAKRLKKACELLREVEKLFPENHLEGMIYWLESIPID